MLNENSLQDLANAASMRLHFYQVKKDLEFIKNGGKIYYAIDTDIIFLHTSSQNFESKAERYMRVFSSDSKKHLLAMAKAVSENIFYGEYKEQLIMLRPHIEELNDIFNNIVIKNLHQSSYVSKKIEELPEKIKNILTGKENIKSWSDKDYENFIQEIREYVPAIVDILLNQDALTVIKSTKKLLDTNLLKRNRELIQQFWDWDTLDFKNSNWEQADNWYQAFRKYMPKNQNDLSIITDSKAFALLYAINKEIEKEKNIRIYILSGSDNIHRAYNTLYYQDRNFSHHYLRHPRQLTSFFQRKNLNEISHRINEIEEILSGLDDILRNVVKETLPYCYSLAELSNFKTNIKKSKNSALAVLKELPSNFELISNITMKKRQKEWQNSRELAVLTEESLYIDRDNNANSDAEKIKKFLKNGSLLEYINSSIEESIDVLSKLFGITGFISGSLSSNRGQALQQVLSILSKSSKNPQKAKELQSWRRMPCSLRFGKNIEILEFSALIQKSSHSNSEAKKLYEYITILPLSGLNITLSYILALAGEWQQAKHFCEKVLRSQLYKKRPDDFVVEAEFFMAVILRHLEPSPEATLKALEHLKKAKEIRKQIYEPKTELAYNLAGLANEDLRFDSEWVAQILGFHNRQFFRSTDERSRYDKEFASKIPSPLEAAKKLVKLYKKVSSSNWSEVQYVRERLLTQIMTNICGIYIMYSFIGNKEFEVCSKLINKELVSKALERLKRVAIERNNNVSYYVQFTIKLTQWLLLDTKERDKQKTELINQIENIVKKLNITDFGIQSWDCKKMQKSLNRLVTI